MGLRIGRAAAAALVERVTTMEESTVYQVILEKGVEKGEARGRVEEARTALLRIARQRFGAPSRAVQKAVTEITDLDRLHRMLDRVLNVQSWRGLLDTP